MLKNLRIVLVHTTHPANIGAVARAMKNMGLNQLYLVAPKHFPSAVATWRAANATDLLDQATVVDTLADAVGDCELVMATSARARSVAWPLITPREAAAKAKPLASKDAQVAIVFGRESSGLTNEELEQSHFQIHIPTNPEYNVLNLAQAVQIIVYELFMAATDAKIPGASAGTEAQAPMQHMEYFFEHLEQLLTEIDFFKSREPELLMKRLRRIFLRSELTSKELSILRGILTETMQQLQEPALDLS